MTEAKITIVILSVAVVGLSWLVGSYYVADQERLKDLHIHNELIALVYSAKVSRDCAQMKGYGIACFDPDRRILSIGDGERVVEVFDWSIFADNPDRMWYAEAMSLMAASWSDADYCGKEKLTERFCWSKKQQQLYVRVGERIMSLESIYVR